MPIALYVKSPLVLVVDPALPIKSVADLIKYAKSSANPLTYSTPGAGAFQHLSTEFMAQRFGLKFTHVPYKSTPQSVTDIAAGHVNFGLAEAGASLPLIRGGKLRALAVSSTTRAADAARRAAVRDRRQCAGLRGGVLACPGRARGDAEGRSSIACTRKWPRSCPTTRCRSVPPLTGLLPISPPSIADTQKYIASEREKWGNLVRSLGLAGTQ